MDYGQNKEKALKAFHIFFVFLVTLPLAGCVSRYKEPNPVIGEWAVLSIQPKQSSQTSIEKTNLLKKKVGDMIVFEPRYFFLLGGKKPVRIPVSYFKSWEEKRVRIIFQGENRPHQYYMLVKNDGSAEMTTSNSVIKLKKLKSAYQIYMEKEG